MTEIKAKKIYYEKRGLMFCAVDNHGKKKGSSYQIIYRAETPIQLREFMIEKGIW